MVVAVAGVHGLTAGLGDRVGHVRVRARRAAPSVEGSTMTANQVVAYNVAKARSLRHWTQQQAAERLAPFLGASLSPASFSALERSAWNAKRIKVFSADELVALARGFDLPLGFFLVPPPLAHGILLSTPASDGVGEDPMVLLDAVLGTPENLVHLQAALLESSASPPPTARGRGEGARLHAEARRLMTSVLTRMRMRSGEEIRELQSSLKLVVRLLEQLDVVVDGAAKGGGARQIPQERRSGRSSGSVKTRSPC
jgi:hypothetical protein